MTDVPPRDHERFDDRFLTRREAEILIGNEQRAESERFEAHQRDHEQQAKALDTALAATNAKQTQHDIAHNKAHEAHEEKHQGAEEAVRTAMGAVSRERIIHSDAHDREHTAHMREHGLNNLAIDKAEQATDKRFASTNAYREQINDMIRTLASREAVEVLIKDVDRRMEEARKDRERRYEELRQQIIILQQSDVKAEGRGMGQGATIAYIVTAITIVSMFVGMFVIFAR